MFGIRLFFVYKYPSAIGDASVYLTVARNIFLNGCVSLSIPESAECLPHWGGNQLPGYPAFIAASWALLGESNTVVRWMQALVSGASLLYLAWTAALWSKSQKFGLIVGLVLALSPTTAGWSRHLFTESLAIAATAWVFAEIIRSFAEKRLRVLPIGLGLAVAVFVRIDLLSLCIPVAIAGFMIETPTRAIYAGAVIAVLVASPIAIWTARSLALGLPAVPDLTIDPKGEKFPQGFKAWGNTWVVDEYQLGIWMYPAMVRQYSKITIPDNVIDNQREEERTNLLLARLLEFEGQSMPPDIDAEFAAIASERAKREPIRQWFLLPLKRMAAMWFNPASSTGLPIAKEIVGSNSINDPNTRIELLSGAGLGRLLRMLSKYPELIIYKGMSLAERVSFALFSLFALFAVTRRSGKGSQILGLALIFSVTRLLMFAFFGVPTTRYVVEGMPLLATATILALAEVRRHRRQA